MPAIWQVVGRRMARVAEGEGVRPDVLLIDGGKGQVKKASEALADDVMDVSIPVKSELLPALIIAPER